MFLCVTSYVANYTQQTAWLKKILQKLSKIGIGYLPSKIRCIC